MTQTLAKDVAEALVRIKKIVDSHPTDNEFMWYLAGAAQLAEDLGMTDDELEDILGAAAADDDD